MTQLHLCFTILQKMGCALIFLFLFQQPTLSFAERVLIGAPKSVLLEVPSVEKSSRMKNEYLFSREWGWRIAEMVFQGVTVAHDELSVSDAHVPLWLTWLDANEGAYLFSELYLGLTRAQRLAKRDFSNEKIDEVIENLPKRLQAEPYFSKDRLRDLVRSIQSQEQLYGVRGPSHILLDPNAMGHELANYKNIYDCIRDLVDLSPDRVVAGPLRRDGLGTENRTLCFRDESPPSAVVIKAVWRRVHPNVPLFKFDTSASGLRSLRDNFYKWNGVPVSDNIKVWRAPLGLLPFADREFVAPTALQSEHQQSRIFEIQTPTGQRYQLVGFHIMSKILRDWVWVTLWWSDTPSTDFGEDRPKHLQDHPFALDHYKMCIATNYEIPSQELTGLERATYPSLSTAIDATREMNPTSSWCSNPYIEEGHNNARTNCIGCHQHGGSQFDVELALKDNFNFESLLLMRNRENFPADYYWAFRQLKNGATPTPQRITELVDYLDLLGDDAYRARARRALQNMIWKE